VGLDRDGCDAIIRGVDDAVLARIDRRLAVTEDFVRQSAEALPKIAEALPKIAEALPQIAEHMRQGNEYMLDARAASERQAQAFEDLRISTRQWDLRQEKMMRELLAAAQENTASIRELREESRELREASRELRDESREQRAEGREEARAQRAALFAILDQLKAGGGPATA